MVSSFYHLLRGQYEPWAVATTVTFSLWWLIRCRRSRSLIPYIAVAVVPLLWLPDIKFPLSVKGKSPGHPALCTPVASSLLPWW